MLVGYFDDLGADYPGVGFDANSAVARRVVELMRNAENSERFEAIVREMRSIEAMPHHRGTGWNEFTNCVRCWLEERGYPFSR